MQPVATLSAYSLQLSALNLMHRSHVPDFEKGRDLLQARHDPWVQQAQLQVSGQWAKDEEIARQREREAGLCQASGCPYALRAPCAQPFCLEMRVGTPLAAPMAALDVIAGRAGTTGSVTPL